MKESYGEDIASHTGPESCVGVREADGEALTGVQAGRVLSRESKYKIGVPTPFSWWEGKTGSLATARGARAPRGLRPCARLETLRSGPGMSRVRRPRDGTAARMANPMGARP